MKFLARVEVGHQPGILDPQGVTVQRALPALGYENVSEVKIGKSIRLVIEATSESDAREQIEKMCEHLLTNPVIETYEISLVELTGDAADNSAGE
ncbi:MAG: phosphoribosylformylglycinamidine synthase subunit PurS [Actinobacteria bacterium]|uniref:Unannotated protein n=1 Tax=freshwater metagenome TaxID=449393 RepID=A0A6J7ND19_9ZZZZ|nr:phosphoribosylformylglycinamidine synthase subunit PurS [Actinomycetota bacterium]